MTRGLRSLSALQVAAVLCMTTAAHAFPASFVLAGTVGRGGVRFNGPVHVVVALHADATDGAPVYVEESDAIVLDGLLVLDVGAQGTLDVALLAAPALFAELTVDNVTLTPRIAVPAAALALRATLADLADVAADAAQFGDVVPAAIATRTALATAGAAAVAFANLSGVPTGIADGDNDTLYTTGAGIALDTESRFFLSQVPGASFQGGAINAATLQSVSADDLADGAFTAADFDSDHTVALYAAALGCPSEPALSTGTVCRRGTTRIDGVACTGGDFATCDGLACTPTATNCPTTLVGRLVFAP